MVSRWFCAEGGSLVAITEEIWQEYSKTRSSILRNKIIEHYMEFVSKMVGKLFTNQLPTGMDKEDLYQFGVCGLIEAVDRYDLSLGAKFETYASWRIKGAIVDGIRSYGKTSGAPSRTAIEKMKMLEKAIQNLERKFKRHPTQKEIAEELQMTTKEYNKLLADISVGVQISLDKMVGLDDNLPAIEVIKNEKGLIPEEEFVNEEYIKLLEKAIDDLDEKEKLIISLYYYEELTLKEIGQILNLSEGRISQMHTLAVTRLKAKINEGV